MSLAHHQNCLLEKNMPRPLKTLALALATLIVLAAFLASCGSGNTTPARFVNAIADDNQSLDIDFNGSKVFGGVNPFPSDSGSTYLNIPTGSYTIAGFASGTTTNPVFSKTSPVSFNSGSQYTVVATGFLSGNSVVFLAPTDTNTAPVNGNVNFRVIDASTSGPGSVDVYILANPVIGSIGCPANCPSITALGVTSTSDYKTLPYNNLGYTMFVTVSGNPTPLPGWNGGFPLTGGQLALGTIRTVVLVDVGGGGAMSAQPLVLADLN
jgi:Domain of unknown function (DUF4397)